MDKRCDRCNDPIAFIESVAAGRCYRCRGEKRPTPSLLADMPGAVVAGVGTDAPTTTNAHGGKQSACPYRCDLLPAQAVLAVAGVLKRGADKYGENNWQLISARENINHALTHLLALQAGDASDKHLENAACRVLFALDQVLSGRDAKLAGKGGAA